MTDKKKIEEGYQPLKKGYQPIPKPNNQAGESVTNNYQSTASEAKPVDFPSPPPKKP